MLKVIELFAGIGSQRAALDRALIPHEVVGVSEIDKYAYAAYQAIHGATKNFGDITKIERLPYADFWTYSFPCTDISLAGKQQGLQHESKQEQGLFGMLFDEPTTTHVKPTRSGLLYEVQRLLWVAKGDNTLPKFLLLENVKALVGSKFMGDFQGWLDELDMLGYNSYWKVLNGKEYGIPQNRERVFVVSIRKDVDNGKFKWPMRFPLKLRLKDMLEDKVDEKYFISDKMLRYISQPGTKTYKVDTRINLDVARPITTEHGKRAGTTNYIGLDAPDNFDLKMVGNTNPSGRGMNGNVYDIEKISPTLTTNKGEGIKIIGHLNLTTHEQTNRVYDPSGISPTINTMQGGNLQPKIAIPEATKQGYALAGEGDGVYLNRPYQKRGVVQQGMIQTIKTDANDIGVVVYDDYNSQIRADQDTIGTLTTNIGNDAPRNGYKLIEPNLRVRKLTPRECYRLMGFTDEQFDKAASVCSNSQLYKQAGNSIIVDVLYYIFKELFKDGVTND